MLAEKLKRYKIILASQSPRRKALFETLDLPYSIEVRPVEEVFEAHLKSFEITNYLARLKAEAFQSDLAADTLVITSDTIVWHDGEALGKPQNYNEAKAMLQRLSGATHEVYTSVCYTSAHKQLVEYDCTKVTFKTLSIDEMDYYITKFQPFDKAGAYGIQDWIGQIGITHMEGSYFNVMGFPVHRVYKTLNEAF